MTSFVIDRGVPLPERKPLTRGPSKIEEALKTMAVGDSVLLNGKSHVCTPWSKYAKKLGFKVQSRQITSEPPQFRVWRTA